MNGIVAKLDLNVEFKSIGSVNIFLYAIACNLCTSILANKECNSCSVVLSQGLFCPAVEVSISRWGKMQGTTVVIVVIVNWMQLLNICFPFRLWPWFSRHHTTFLCPQNSYIRVNECEQVHGWVFGTVAATLVGVPTFRQKMIWVLLLALVSIPNSCLYAAWEAANDDINVWATTTHIRNLE